MKTSYIGMYTARKHVVKRNGKFEDISYDKVTLRLRNLCALPDDMNILVKVNPEKYSINKTFKPLTNVDYHSISQSVISGIYNGITTSELDDSAAAISQPMVIDHPEYGALTSRILISNYHKNTLSNLIHNFSDSHESDIQAKLEKNMLLYTAEALYQNVDVNDQQYPLIAPDILKVIRENADALEKIIDYTRDYNYDYAGFNMLCGSYLQKCSLKENGKVIFEANKTIKRFLIERPQHLIMRVVLGMVCSKKYENFDKKRQNDKAIFAELRTILKKYLNKDSMEKFISDANHNRVVWSEIKQMIKDKKPVLTEDRTFDQDIYMIDQIIEKHSISWNELLDQYDGKLTKEQWQDITESYEMISNKCYTPATPSLFNSGTLKPQQSSCFLVQLAFDSMGSISDFWKTIAEIAKWAGGIGSHVHSIRGKNSYIRGTNGTSNGLPPMLKVVNDISIYVDQCFGSETIVYSKAGIRKICDINVGDELLTNDGTYQKVLEVRQYPSSGKEIFSINTWQSRTPIMVTGEHPIYCINTKNMNLEEAKARIKQNQLKANYVIARELTEKHLIGTPIPTYENDISLYSVDDCYFYGLMLLFGEISSDKIQYMIPLLNEENMKFIKNYFDNLNVTLQLGETRDYFTFTKSPNFPITHAMIYPSAGVNKKHICANMLHLPKEKIIAIIHGMLSNSDSMYNSKYSKIIYEHDEQVLEGLKYLLLRLGISSEINGTMLHFSKTPEVVEAFDIPECSTSINNTYSFVHEGMLYNPVIRSTRDFSYHGLLTDFEMKNNHNYVTNLGLVHNGGNKRPGSHAVFLEPHHRDIFEVIDLKKNRGNDQERARQLFYAMWLNDEFMRTVVYESALEPKVRERVVRDKTDMHGNPLPPNVDVEEVINGIISNWYLMCPDQSPNLSNLYDEGFKINWIPDEELFDPKKADYYKKYFAFTYTYRTYVKEKQFVKKVSAKKLWVHICEVIIESGIPYLCYKDSANRKSNQKHSGTIKSSNLCTEIFQISNAEEIGVCNLSSINQMSFITDNKPKPNIFTNKFIAGFETSIKLCLGQENAVSKKKYIDWNLYERILRRSAKNLNKVIDTSYYPVKEARYSNMRHRPFATGTQNLANVLSVLRLPVDSKEAAELNFYLYEFHYYILLDESCNLAIKHREEKIHEYESKLASFRSRDEVFSVDEIEEFDRLTAKLKKYESSETSGSYKTFVGSPASKGILQFDMWIAEQTSIGNNGLRFPLSMDWDRLKERIMKFGLRNSLVCALMPTASTSTLLGCTPSMDLHAGLISKRRDKAGETVRINEYFVNDMIELGIWDKSLINEILLSRNGGIAKIMRIPNLVRSWYKTSWDVSVKVSADLMLDRACFIDEGQSWSNLTETPNINNLTQVNFYNWRHGAKTSSYYTRRLAPVDANKIQVSSETPEPEVCRIIDGKRSCCDS